MSIRLYDDQSPAEAARLAWSNPGRSPETHRKAQDMVRSQMPLLARALDRLVDTGRKA